MKDRLNSDAQRMLDRAIRYGGQVRQIIGTHEIRGLQTVTIEFTMPAAPPKPDPKTDWQLIDVWRATHELSPAVAFNPWLHKQIVPDYIDATRLNMEYPG